MRFFATAVTIWIVAHAWLAWRLVPGLPSRGLRIAGWIALAVLALAPLPGLSILRGWGWAGEGLGFLANVAMGLSSILVVILVAAEVGRGFHRAGRRLGVRGFETPASPERRAFFRQVADLGVVGTALGSTGVGLTTALGGPRLQRVEVPIAGLDPRLHGFRIAQVSDLHVGPLIRRAYVEEVAALVREARADLLAFTGDMVEARVAEVEADLSPLRELEARHGKFFVTGNHEYYWDGPAWCSAFGRMGCIVLNNDHRVLDHDGAGLVIAGVTDYRAGRGIEGHASDPVRALHGAPSDVPRILLAHQPRSIFAAAEVGIDLQLSGHTHGGQYFPMNLLVHLVQPYVRGLYDTGSSMIYVSRGAGYFGPPLRGGEPAEVAVVELVPA